MRCKLMNISRKGDSFLSPTHLRRICAAESQMSPLRKLAALRMEHAKTLLSVMDMKIAEVAALAGYANMFAFSAAFKRQAGIPPSEWRERAQRQRNSRGIEGAKLPS